VWLAEWIVRRMLVLMVLVMAMGRACFISSFK
jgi:hypothetical protein